MNIWHVIILGIIEGITEFLPISSTGHLIVAGKLMGLADTEFLKTFDVAIQLGAILAVLVLYGRTLVLNKKIIGKVMFAFIPTAVIGLALYKLIKQFLLSNDLVVAWALLIGGIVLIVFEMLFKPKTNDIGAIENMSAKQAIGIGLFQSLAVVPGVSRAAATIIGGLCLRLQRKTIVEFSFLLAIPTMAAATGLDLLKTGLIFSGQEYFYLGAGFLVSFLVALVGIKFLLYYIQKNNFISFGVYRILAAILFLFLR